MVSIYLVYLQYNLKSSILADRSLTYSHIMSHLLIQRNQANKKLKHFYY